MIRSGSLPVHRVVSQSVDDGCRLDLAQKYSVHRGEERKLVLLSLRFEHHVHLKSRLWSLLATIKQIESNSLSSSGKVAGAILPVASVH